MTSNENIVQFPHAVLDNNLGRRLIPARLTEARLAERLSQTELAKLIGVSRQSVSAYELGDKTPEPVTMAKTTEALKQPLSFFTSERPQTFGPPSANFFRKVGQDTKRRNLACEIYADWLGQTAFAFDSFVNFPAVDIPAYEPKDQDTVHYSDDEIEEIAEKTREHFGLGLGPISNMLRLLEAKGVLVCRLQIPNENIEAFSYWRGSRPFVFMASDKESASRARYDLAHELGHLVLHRWIGKEEIEDKKRLKEIEAEADRFAGAFLLPAKSFPNEIYSPRIMAFIDLKHRWKVSIAAMVYRCKDLEIFDEQQITNLYKQISYKKWRKKEPLDGPDGLPLEQPILLTKVAELVLEAGKLQRDELTNSIGLSATVIEQLTGLQEGHLGDAPVGEYQPTLK